MPTNDQPMGRVIRRATPKEVQHLHSVQTELEKRCTEVCQQKVIEHGLVLVVVDAEYQFDRKKLTFYYDAAERFLLVHVQPWVHSCEMILCTDLRGRGRGSGCAGKNRIIYDYDYDYEKLQKKSVIG